MYEFFKKNWIRFIVAFVIALGLLFLYVGLRGAEAWSALVFYSDGAFIGGFSAILIGGLSVVNGFGGFDMASYYFRRRQIGPGQKEDLYQYSTRKAEARKANRLAFLPYVIVGAIFVIFAIVTHFVAYAG